VNRLLTGLLGAFVALGQLSAATNGVVPSTNAAVAAPDPNDPVEKEYKKLMADDDEAQGEVDEWIKDNEKFTAQGAGVPGPEMSRRIRQRLEPIRSAYEDFIRRHPEHARARVAYGSFLNDLHDDDGAQEQWEKALALDPKDPAIYNNLANLYGHTGPVKKAFEYYAKAIELNPREPIYYHNFGTTVFLFRKDAREFYEITEQQVFDKALELYSKALRLDPQNFPLASDVAQTYYGIRPLRTEDALKAWTNTLAIAQNEVEREGVYLHLARFKLIAGRFAEARAHLNCVTNETYNELRTRLKRNLDEQEKQAQQGTNAKPAKVEQK
jgi:tetratricopeptide (TPR) repeat protein